MTPLIRGFLSRLGLPAINLAIPLKNISNIFQKKRAGILRDYAVVFGVGADATPSRSSLPTLSTFMLMKNIHKIQLKSQIIQ
jgi:hypothetical protein